MRRFTSIAIASLLFVTASTAGAQPKPGDADWKDEPGKAADPPLIPAPQQQPQNTPPLSTSGTDVVPADRGPSAPPPPIVVDDKDESLRREARLRQLEERIAADERRIRRLDERTKLLRHLKFGAYIQPQLLIES